MFDQFTLDIYLKNGDSISIFPLQDAEILEFYKKIEREDKGFFHIGPHSISLGEVQAMIASVGLPKERE